MSQFKAVLFDMDGTLVNTEPLHQEAWFDTLKQFDLTLSSDWFHKYTGSTDRILIADVKTHFQLDLNIDELIVDKKNRFLVMAESRSQVFEGVIEGLSNLKSNYELALVTSSTREGAMCVLESTGLTSFFKTIITFDDVDKHKPDPMPYTKAVQFFGLKAEECIAIEDSVSGTIAAKTAGCFTIGVLNSLDADKLECTDKIFETTRDVMNYLHHIL